MTTIASAKLLPSSGAVGNRRSPRIWRNRGGFQRPNAQASERPSVRGWTPRARLPRCAQGEGLGCYRPCCTLRGRATEAFCPSDIAAFTASARGHPWAAQDYARAPGHAGTWCVAWFRWRGGARHTGAAEEAEARGRASRARTASRVCCRCLGWYPWSSQLPRRYAALLSWRTALGGCRRWAAFLLFGRHSSRYR